MVLRARRDVTRLTTLLIGILLLIALSSVLVFAQGFSAAISGVVKPCANTRTLDNAMSSRIPKFLGGHFRRRARYHWSGSAGSECHRQTYRKRVDTYCC